MTNQQNHPITPPPKLVQQWLREEAEGGTFAEHFATQAARWGADQELEACCEFLDDNELCDPNFHKDLRAARRPQPPSLKPTPLSPAADAVLDAASRKWLDVDDDIPAQVAVAALRAAADQVVPEYKTTPGGSKIWPSEPLPSIRAALLAIAAELEGAHDDPN